MSVSDSTPPVRLLLQETRELQAQLHTLMEESERQREQTELCIREMEKIHFSQKKIHEARGDGYIYADEVMGKFGGYWASLTNSIASVWNKTQNKNLQVEPTKANKQ